MKFKICNTWEVEIDEDIVERAKEEEGKKIDNIPHLASLTKGNADEINRHLYAFRDIAKDIEKGGKVIEFFGGSGFQTMIIQKIIQPNQHLVYDISEICVEHMKRMFPGQFVDVRRADSFERFKIDKCDTAICDFNTFTALRLVDDRKVESSLKKLLEREQLKYVTITDSSKTKMHLNNKVYQKWLDYEIENFVDYCKGFSRYLFKEFGFSVKKVNYHYGASILFLQRAPVPENEIQFQDFSDII